MSEKMMNNVRAVMALNDLKVYANTPAIEALDYAIAVLEKLEQAGVTKPLETLNPQGK